MDMLLGTAQEKWEKRFTKKVREKLRNEGKEEGKKEVAKKLFAMHLSFDQIMQATDLPREELEKIISKVTN